MTLRGWRTVARNSEPPIDSKFDPTSALLSMYDMAVSRPQSPFSTSVWNPQPVVV
jgi:hypothetical protein